MSKHTKTNPKPFIVAGYSIIVLTFGVVGGWASTAKLDRAVIANGEIDVASNRKEIQHLEGGIISKIMVSDGDIVHAGETLVHLDDVQPRATLQILSVRLHIAQAQEARLQAERSLQESFDFPEALKSDDTREVQASIADQREIFRDRLSVMKSQVDILQNRIEQLHREIEGLKGQREAYEQRATVLLQRLDRMRSGLKSGVIQPNVVSTYEDEYIDVKANVARMDTEVAKSEKAIGETNFQILQTQQQYRERASSEYKEVNGQIQELIAQVKVARDTVERTDIVAPVDGVVQSLRFHTTGGVVRAGEILMEIMPNNDEMVINAHVAPIDIDSVRPGLKAEIKFPSFPSRYMPLIIGKVDSVSKGSINPNDGKTAPYFLARVNVSKGMVPDELENRLSAGMPAEILISAGERTVVDYLTSPITDAVRKSMRED